MTTLKLFDRKGDDLAQLEVPDLAEIPPVVFYANRLFLAPPVTAEVRAAELAAGTLAYVEGDPLVLSGGQPVTEAFLMMDDQKMPVSGDSIAAEMDAAFHHPDSHVLLVLYQLHDDLHCKIMARPSTQIVEVLEALTSQLRTALKTRAN